MNKLLSDNLNAFTRKKCNVIVNAEHIQLFDATRDVEKEWNMFYVRKVRQYPATIVARANAENVKDVCEMYLNGGFLDSIC